MQVLGNLGLSKNESKVYASLLRNGLSTAGNIAEKSKVHRSNVYDVVERLIEKGLVCYINKENTRYFEAAEPENLMNLVKEREIELNRIMPSLMLDRKLAEKKSEIHIHEGAAALRMIMNSILEHRKTILMHGIPKAMLAGMKEFLDYYNGRRARMKILLKLMHNSLNNIEKLPYTESKHVQNGSNVSTIVCNDEVVVAVWSKKLLVVHIINKDIAEQYKEYFEAVWGAAA